MKDVQGPAASMDILAANKIRKRFDPAGADIFSQFDLQVRRGDFVSLVGPSGCGKSTLLFCLAGLMPVTGGQVLFKGHRVDGPPAGLAVVFQDYSRSLFPWRRNIDNVAFGMRRITGLSRRERLGQSAELLASVGLRGFERHYPWQLSGGMQQRVAIARALASRSELLLLDEPFASVDAQTRADMQGLILDITAKFKQTCILVTHDIEEAIYLGNHLCVLSSRPSRIVTDITVDLAYPRNQITTREDPRFLQLRHRVLDLIQKGSKSDAPLPLSPEDFA